jgi:molecular chaperone Hsp33
VLTRAFRAATCACSRRARPLFACRCSAARVEQALRIAGRDEVEAALADDGEVRVTCEYCGRRYTFTPNQARALFDAPAT